MSLPLVGKKEVQVSRPNELNSSDELCARILAELLSDLPDTTTRLLHWWQGQQQTQENLTRTLRRLGLIERATERELDAVAKGYLQLTDPTTLFAPASLKLLREQLAAIVLTVNEESSKVSDTLAASVNEPIATVNEPTAPLTHTVTEQVGKTLQAISEPLQPSDSSQTPPPIQQVDVNWLIVPPAASTKPQPPAASTRPQPPAAATKPQPPAATNPLPQPPQPPQSQSQPLPQPQSLQLPPQPPMPQPPVLAVMPTPEPGQVIDGYQLVRVIGSGPRTLVYEAKRPDAQGVVALKLLQPTIAAKDPVRRRQFEHQMRIPQQFEHPGCMPVLSVTNGPDYIYCILPFWPRGSLADRLLHRGPMQPTETVRVCRMIAATLYDAHARNITHGNLRLSNIFLTEQGQVKLADFLSPLSQAASQATPSVAVQEDIRQLGIICYQMLTGRLPQQMPPGESESGISGRCLALILRATSGIPGHGFASMNDFLQELELIEEELRGSETQNLQVHVNTPVATDSSLGRPASSSRPRPDANNRSLKELQVGQILGKCLLTEQVGRGATGIVYRGLHQNLNIPVAIKVLQVSAIQSHAYAQLRTEACLLAQLNHPNIVRVWDFEDNAQCPFIVLEYVEGLSLAELIQQSGRLRLDRALRIVMQVASGLEAGERLGIVHRDVKPANILIAKDGTAKLADLGLATLVSSPSDSQSESSINAEGLAGTVAYMAPEQASNPQAVDHRADIYALGVTFYHILTGQLPFTGRSRMEVLLKHARETPIPPHEIVSELDPAVSEVITKMMGKSPQQRHATYADLLDDLMVLMPLAEASRMPGASSSRQNGLSMSQSGSAVVSESVGRGSGSGSLWKTIFRLGRSSKPGNKEQS